MTAFWQNDLIVWEEGIKEMHLVMKDDTGGSGHAHKRADPEKFFPTKMRITMIQVAKGGQVRPEAGAQPARTKVTGGHAASSLFSDDTGKRSRRFAPDGRLGRIKSSRHIGQKAH